MKPVTSRFLPLTVLTLALLGVTGCRSIGPSTVKRDRLHYSTAVADSWKEQLLLNIVKTRYGDAPAFLEVASVVSGYSLETGVSVNGEFSPENLRGDTFVGGELSGTFTDRPTISYTPMTGEKFARSLLAPIPLEALVFVLAGGVPADFILGLTVQAIEGRHNVATHGETEPRADPEFLQLLQLLRGLQQTKLIESETTRQGEHMEVGLRFHLADSSRAAGAEQVRELKKLLGVPAGQDRVKIVFGSIAPEPEVIGIRTRSLLQMLGALGAGVRIPPAHLAEGRASSVNSSRLPGGFTVYGGKDKPDEAFVAVPYEGLWFWIDRRDLASKNTLTVVTVLFNFLEGGGSKSAPVLTIPTN